LHLQPHKDELTLHQMKERKENFWIDAVEMFNAPIGTYPTVDVVSFPDDKFKTIDPSDFEQVIPTTKKSVGAVLHEKWQKICSDFG
jgi:hypothetical protein